MASTSASDSETDIIKKLCARHLHQSLWLPSTNDHERLRITYSTTSNFDDVSLPVVLFPGPMFSSRWHALELDKLAGDAGVRVVCSDRPSMGGSTPVELKDRIQVWLETVSELLKALDVEHVSIMTHSAGTMYTLNTVYHLRHVLDPEKPFVAFMAPWVHNSHTNATLMKISSMLPSGAVGSFDSLQRFIVTKINPAIGWSGGIFNSISDLFQDQPGAADPGTSSEAEKYGLSKEDTKTLNVLLSKYMYAENTAATSQEALLCLKKQGGSSWGCAEDYAKCVREIAAREKEVQSSSTEGTKPSKLQVKAYFAPSDIMIGKEGQKYFEQCWRQDGISDTVNFESTVVPDTNHETIIADYKKTAVRKIFEEIKAAHTV